MKAEERKRLEHNELSDKLQDVWSGVSSTSPKATKVWAVILVVLLLVLGWVLYSRYAGNQQVDLWTNFYFSNESGDQVAQFEKLIQESPNSLPGLFAKMDLARYQILDATSKLAVLNPDDRVKAANTLETVRRMFGELAQATKLPPTVVQEAMLQRARAEEILASVPSEKNPAQMRGSLDQAIKYYEEVKAKDAKGFAGEQATKRLETLKSKKAEVEKLYEELAKEQGKPVAPPAPVGVVPAPPAPPAPPPADPK